MLEVRRAKGWIEVLAKIGVSNTKRQLWIREQGKGHTTAEYRDLGDGNVQFTRTMTGKVWVGVGSDWRKAFANRKVVWTS